MRATIANALSVGYLRLVADKHYLIDVLAGATIGFASGFGFALYHYRHSTTSTVASQLRETPTVNFAFGTF